jgi:proteasome accessory factor B
MVRARTGAGVALRRRATSETPGKGWDELVVPFGDAEALAQEVAGYGSDVVALEPPELREAVVRRLQAVLGEQP